MTIKIRNLFHDYDNTVIFEDFNLNIPDNAILGIYGPSGCGKTTLLNIISGVISPKAGSIIGVESTKISYIFQDDRLLRLRSVRENLTFVKPERANAHPEVFIDLVGLKGYENAYPDTLSGGMRKRVSIARAFYYPSTLLLMDEPFNGIDTDLKEKLIRDFRILWEEHKRTVIFVSHHQGELLKLCTEIIELSDKPIKIRKKKLVNQ